MSVVSIPGVAAATPDPWRPVDLVTANDTIVRLARLDADEPAVTLLVERPETEQRG